MLLSAHYTILSCYLPNKFPDRRFIRRGWGPGGEVRLLLPKRAGRRFVEYHKIGERDDRMPLLRVQTIKKRFAFRQGRHFHFAGYGPLLIEEHHQQPALDHMEGFALVPVPVRGDCRGNRR